MTPRQQPRRHTCDGTSRVCRVALAVAMVETNVKMKTRSGKREETTTRGVGRGRKSVQCEMPFILKINLWWLIRVESNFRGVSTNEKSHPKVTRGHVGTANSE
jgi:hypothetical protein